MPLKTMQDLLVKQLIELVAGEKHHCELLPQLADAATNPKLASAFRNHAKEEKEHVTRLETVFEDLGIQPKSARTESKAMKGLADDCLRLARTRSAEPHVRDAALIAVAQHIQHDEMAGYGCARTWAELLGHDSASAQLQKSLDEERKADADLTRLADTLNKAALTATTS